MRHHRVRTVCACARMCDIWCWRQRQRNRQYIFKWGEIHHWRVLWLSFDQTTHFFRFFFFGKEKKIYFSLFFDSKNTRQTLHVTELSTSYFLEVFLFRSCDSVVVCNMSDIFTATDAASSNHRADKYPSRIRNNNGSSGMGKRLASKPIQITWLVYNFNWQTIYELVPAYVCDVEMCVEWISPVWVGLHHLTHPLYHVNIVVEQQIAWPWPYTHIFTPYEFARR